MHTLLRILPWLLIGAWCTSAHTSSEQRCKPLPPTVTKGKRHGIEQRCWPNGHVRRRGRWCDGELCGQWQSWFANGRLRSKTQWREDNAHGRWMHWYKDGTKRAEYRFDNGKQHGATKLWYPNGKRHAIVEYRRNKKHGMWRIWYPSGKRKERSTWHHNKEHLTHKRWYPNGKRRSTSIFRKGKKIGLWRAWYANGVPRYVLAFRNHVQHGAGTYWHANGNRMTSGTWSNDRPHGVWRTWYPSGKLRSRVTWHHGKTKGTVRRSNQRKRPASRPIPTSSPTTRITRQPREKGFLSRLRSDMRKASPKMHRMGFPLDGSYCHIGAGYMAAHLANKGIQTRIFQPTTAHTLTSFQWRGRTYLIDQAMAQFFKKGSRAHRKLIQSGGFVGTKADFLHFYKRHIDEVKGAGTYMDGGWLPKTLGDCAEDIVPYEMFAKGQRWQRYNAKEARVKRVIATWYGNFHTDTSYEQDTGLFWTATYFQYTFEAKLHPIKQKASRK